MVGEQWAVISTIDRGPLVCYCHESDRLGAVDPQDEEEQSTNMALTQVYICSASTNILSGLLNCLSHTIKPLDISTSSSENSAVPKVITGNWT